MDDNMGASKPTGLSQAEPQDGLGPSGFDPSRIDGARVFLGPFLVDQGLDGAFLGVQAGKVYEAAARAVSTLLPPHHDDQSWDAGLTIADCYRHHREEAFRRIQLENGCDVYECANVLSDNCACMDTYLQKALAAPAEGIAK